MVECSLDTVFGALADPIRRDILERVSDCEMSVSEIAMPYDISMAAVSKHLKVLQVAGLISKRRSGKQRLVRAEPLALEEVRRYLSLIKS